MSDTAPKLNPLFTIFEKHLYDFDEKEETQSGFIDKIVGDYMSFLVTNKVAIPKRWQAQITEELRDQVRQMLVKKMYGCLSIEEFLHRQPDRGEKRRREIRRKYSKLF